MQATSRRGFVRGAGLGLLAFSVAGVPALLTPREARARDAELSVLSAGEVESLEALGEAMAPGAAEAGLAWYVDQQLSVAPNESLLIARYFNIPPPYAGFYRAALQAAEALSAATHDKSLSALTPGQAEALARSLLSGQPSGWQGPPAPLVYMVLRNDAIDVVYGTVEGFARLGVPYMPHILPPSRW